MNKWLSIRRGANMQFYNACSQDEKDYILKREILTQVSRKKENLSCISNKNEKDFRVLQVINRKWSFILSEFNKIDNHLTELNYLDSRKEALWKVWLGELEEKDIYEYMDLMYSSPDELLELTNFSIEEWW